MFKLCKRNDESVIKKVKNGEIDSVKLSTTGLVDDILLSLQQHGILDSAFADFPDKRRHNSVVPLNLLLVLATAAKMKVNTSLTDIPYALSDHRIISSLGYNLEVDGASFMDEGSIRNFIGKYTAQDFFSLYGSMVQNHISPALGIESNIHILDCTKICVNVNNKNYEGSELIRFEDELIRGYKLSTLRSIVGDTGIIQDIRFGSLRDHDLTLSFDMLMDTPIFKPGDILINDRGFISRDLINRLKTERGVDSYVPLRKNMEPYRDAVHMAKQLNEWVEHPNPNRPQQRLSPIIDVTASWGEHPDIDVPVHACVVWDTIINEYFVFTTTDTSKTSRQILQTYELRPEIEEDYRQLKDFWKLEDFKSTKLTTIAFHILFVLIGYLFFQIYTMLPEGEHLSGKSLPVILKNYVIKTAPECILYAGSEFAILGLVGVMKLYAKCPEDVQQRLDEIIGDC